MGEEAERGTEGRDGDAIVGEAELVEADFAAAAKVLLPSYPKWIWGVIAAAGLAAAGFTGTSREPLTIVFPALFLIALAASFRKLGGKNWVKSATAQAGGPTTFRFDDFGVGTTSKVRQVRCAWSTLVRHVEGAHAFYVYTAPAACLIVPKRAFEADELGEIRALLTERIVPKPVPWFSAQSRYRVLLLWVVVLVAFLSIWRFLDDQAPEQPAKRSVVRPPPSAQSYAGDSDDDSEDE